MRIRPINLLFAAAGYLVGSGQAQQLWQKAREWMEDRARGAGTGAEPISPTAYDVGPTSLPVTPMESFTA